MRISDWSSDVCSSDLWGEIAADQARLEAELKEEGKSEDQLKGEYRGIAERRIRLGLLLSEVGRINNIEVKPDEITKAMIEQARRFPGQERQVMRSEEHTSELQSLMRISYAVFCLKK